MHPSDRNESRKIFFTAWQKHLQKLPVEPLESQIIAIILAHPEYHALFSNPDDFQQQDFDETNPFLHVSLHLAVREQIATDRPTGIKHVFQKLGGNITAEHKMMECLAQMLWNIQHAGATADEEIYLETLKKL